MGMGPTDMGMETLAMEHLDVQYEQQKMQKLTLATPRSKSRQAATVNARCNKRCDQEASTSPYQDGDLHSTKIASTKSVSIPTPTPKN